MFSLKRFDLAIIPEHDNVPKFDNVVLIKGALSRDIDRNSQYLETIINDYCLKNPPLSHPVIGVLLGGSNKYLSLDREIVEEMIGYLEEIINKLGASVLISTSRRTAKDIESFLKEKLSKRPSYRMLIIANESNPLGSLEAILDLSDILVISSDSISMISEAINSGKYTVIFKLKRKIPYFLSKHERFTENLEKEGFIYVCEDNLPNKLIDIWKYKPPIKRINDREIILERLKKIV